MQTVIDTELIQFEGWTLRVRTSPNPKRLLVLIHGLSGDENSMWVFARDLPAHYWMVAPRAPHKAESGGYAWRPPPFETLDGPSLEQLLPSVEALIRLVDAYSLSAGYEADAGTFDVIGFSQGAVMSSMLAFLYPHRIRKTAILAGFVPLSAQRENEESGIVPGGLQELVTQRPLEGKPFFVTHGTQDQTVTVDRARASIAMLKQAGAQVTYCEDDVGHKVSAKCLNALKKFFAD